MTTTRRPRPTGPSPARRALAAQRGGRRARRQDRARHALRGRRPGPGPDPRQRPRGGPTVPRAWCTAASPRRCTAASASACGPPRRASTRPPRRGIGPGLEDDDRGRFLTRAVNGLIGDRLARERPRLAIPMAVRADGRDVPLDADGLAAAFPRGHGPAGGLPARALRERGQLEPWPRRARHDVRRDARRARAGRRSSCAPTPGWGCARTAWPCPRCSRSSPTPGRSTSPGSPWSATRWAA